MRRGTWLRRLTVLVCACCMLALALVPALAYAAENEPEPIYQTLAELEGKRFAYINGSVYDLKVEAKVKNTKKDFYPSLADCVAAVEAGKADAAVQLSYACQLVVNSKGGTVAMLPEYVEAIDEAYFFPHGDPLVAQFDEVVEKFEKDGTIDALTEKWVGTDDSLKTLPEQDWDAPNGTLKFATTGGLDPISYVGEKGKLLGYDIDLALLIAKELGYHLDISVVPVDAIIACVESGKVDFGGTVTRTDERAEMVDFTRQVMPCYVSVIVPAKQQEATSTAAPEFTTLQELVGKKLGCTAGSVYSKLVADTVEGVSEKDFVSFDSNTDGFTAVKSGKIDAMVEGKSVSELAIARNAGLAILPEEITTDNIGIALRKNSSLTAQFNERIAAYWEDGTIDALHDKWMSADEEAKTMPAQDWDAPNGTLKAICAILDPMAYVDGDGETKGYEAELLLCIARDLGYHIEFSNAQFGGLLAAIESGRVDVAIGNISITEERQQKMDFTDPDYHGAVVAIVRTAEGTRESGGLIEYLTTSFRKTFIDEGRWRLILSGLGVTILISVCSGVLGTLLGFGTVLVRRSGVSWAIKLVNAYQALMGGVPLVVVLMVLYYVVFGKMDIAGEIVAIMAFTLAFGSTAGATMWTAVDSIDTIQEECGLALGFTRSETFREIIFPQASQIFLPQLVGQFVSLVKETAVVGYIAVQDLTRASDLIRARTMDAFFPLLSTALIYFLFCRLLAWALGKLAARLDVRSRPRENEGAES